MFWLEHLLLLLVPIYLIASRRLTVMQPRWSHGLAAYCLMTVYHSLILSIVSLASGINLNYLLVPPPGALDMFGEHYRVVMYLLAIPITVANRLVLWHPIDLIFGCGRLKKIARKTL